MLATIWAYDDSLVANVMRYFNYRIWTAAKRTEVRMIALSKVIWIQHYEVEHLASPSTGGRFGMYDVTCDRCLEPGYIHDERQCISKKESVQITDEHTYTLGTAESCYNI